MANLNETLLNAVIANDLAAVQQLVAAGADINYTETFGNCAVFTDSVVNSNKTEIVNAFMRNAIDGAAKNV